MALQELNALQASSTEKTVIVHFEPWHFSDSKQLLNQFIIRLANEFSSKKDKAMHKIGKALESYSGAFSLAELIPVAGGPIASLGEKVVSKLGKSMQKELTDKDVLRQKTEVIKLLGAQKTKILIVIDDIDRLNNDQIRQVFQLVSAVAKFPNTAYLLIFDKDIVVKALNRVQEGSGEDYLHKIVQMPIQIPEIKESELHKTLFSNLDKIIEEFSVVFHPERWKDIFIPCVSPFISNLRDVNRLLNSIKFKLTTISTEIEFCDMVAISAIEIGAPKVFDWIKLNKNLLVGDLDINSVGTYKRTQSEWLEIYTQLFTTLIDNRVQVKGYAKDRTETVLNALAYLFPPFGSKIGKCGASLSAETARKNCCICNTDKFNRYFDLDIDGIVITKALVEKVIFSYELKELESHFLKESVTGQAYELLEEIRAMVTDIPDNRREIIFLAIMNTLNVFDSKRSHNFLGHSTYTLAEYLAFDILNSVSAPDRHSFFVKALNSSSNVAIEAFAQLINMVELAYGRLAANGVERTEIEKTFSLSELENVEKAFVERCKIILINVNLLELPQWRMTLHLLKSFDAKYTDEYMAEVLKCDKNIVAYILNISSAWIGNGVSYEIQKPPYDYVTVEKIIDAIDRMIASRELFDLDQNAQERAAAFCLDRLGKTSYDGHVTQEDAIAFLKEKK